MSQTWWSSYIFIRKALICSGIDAADLLRRLPWKHLYTYFNAKSRLTFRGNKESIHEHFILDCLLIAANDVQKELFFSRACLFFSTSLHIFVSLKHMFTPTCRDVAECYLWTLSQYIKNWCDRMTNCPPLECCMQKMTEVCWHVQVHFRRHYVPLVGCWCKHDHNMYGMKLQSQAPLTLPTLHLDVDRCASSLCLPDQSLCVPDRALPLVTWTEQCYRSVVLGKRGMNQLR